MSPDVQISFLLDEGPQKIPTLQVWVRQKILYDTHKPSTTKFVIIEQITATAFVFLLE